MIRFIPTSLFMLLLLLASGQLGGRSIDSGVGGLGESVLAALQIEDASVYQPIPVRDWLARQEAGEDRSFTSFIETRIGWATLHLPDAIERLSILAGPDGAIDVSVRLRDAETGVRGAIMLTVPNERTNILVATSWFSQEEGRREAGENICAALVHSGIAAKVASDAFEKALDALFRDDGRPLLNAILRYSDDQMKQANDLGTVTRLAIIRGLRRAGVEFHAPVPDPGEGVAWRLGNRSLYLVPYRRRGPIEGAWSVIINFYSFDESQMDLHGSLVLISADEAIEIRAIQLIQRMFADDFRKFQ